MNDIRGASRPAVFVAALLGGGYSAGAVADESGASTDSLHYEVAPFIGYRMGGSFTLNDTGQRVDVGDHGSFALAFDVQADNGAQYELFYGHQSTLMQGGSSLAPTSIAVEYLHVGGAAALAEQPRVKPYLAGGLGVTRFSPDPTQSRESTRFSVSLGPGVRVPLNSHFSLRLEARGFVTLVNPDTAFFCRSDQTGLLCHIRSHGSTFIQYELLAGAAFSF
ncbi:MAG: outer membrane protein [Steroidobacteraceae bacterium]